MWFEIVRGGSMYLNHPELVHKHPSHLTIACTSFLQAYTKLNGCVEDEDAHYEYLAECPFLALALKMHMSMLCMYVHVCVYKLYTPCYLCHDVV